MTAKNAKKTAPPRLTVNETVIFHPAVGQAKELVSHRDGSFQRILDTDEEPYRRTVTVGEEWQPLDFGWAGPTPSQVCLMNEEGFFSGGIPTAEVKVATFAKVLFLAVRGKEHYITFAKIHPLQSCRFEPVGDNIFVKCAAGEAKLTIAAAPGDRKEGAK